MVIRIVARIRPVPASVELDEVVVHPVFHGRDDRATGVRVDGDDGKEQMFPMDAVYGQDVSQEELFNSEASLDVKSLFAGKDVTYLAYGSSGTGKTHTIRGGLKLDERGVIPRLMSNIYRRAKKLAKESPETVVRVAICYYEIYRDNIYDLLDPPESRTGHGLPLRESGKTTQILGLSEVECPDLKEFSRIYIEANKARATTATKINQHSSRSHAILQVRVHVKGETEKIGTAFAVDLAGAEDTRRAGTSKETLIEAAAINKSLFVLSKCVDAMARGDKRIPSRESKLTRVLGLGKGKTSTTMILTLSPVRTFRGESLGALNFVSRAKRMEVREIENEMVFKAPPRVNSGVGLGGADARRGLRPGGERDGQGGKGPVRMFTVFCDNAANHDEDGDIDMMESTPVVIYKKPSPFKKRVFLAASPAKKSRRPILMRQMMTPMAMDTDSSSEDWETGLRYLQQLRTRRAASGSTEKLQVGPDGEVTRVYDMDCASPATGLEGMMREMSLMDRSCARAPVQRRVWSTIDDVETETPCRVKVRNVSAPAKKGLLFTRGSSPSRKSPGKKAPQFFGSPTRKRGVLLFDGARGNLNLGLASPKKLGKRPVLESPVKFRIREDGSPVRRGGVGYPSPEKKMGVSYAAPLRRIRQPVFGGVRGLRV